jgi:hypothetical protein
MMDRREALRLLARSGLGLAGLGATGSILNGCAQFRPPKLSAPPNKYGITVLVDGFRADMFSRMLSAGALPNIQRHLVDRGTMVENCAGTFPSTSGPAHLAMINGRMPGTNNCPGLRWIDRGMSVIRDYCTIESVFFGKDFPRENYTLYEHLAGQRTVCVFDFVSRGAAEYYRPSLKSLWFMRGDKLEDWQRLDKEAVDVFSRVYQEGPLPTYSFVWMPVIDHLSHLYGSTSQVIEDQAAIVDEQIGRIMAILQNKGIYDKTLVVLSADHGLRETQRSIDIANPLRRAGFSVLRDLGSNDEFNALLTYNAARGVSGNGSALLYFAKRKTQRWATWMGWEDKPSFEELGAFPLEGEGRVDLLELLRSEDAVKFVLAMERDDPELRTYRVFTESGDARIERDQFSRQLKYSVLSGPDPLGYSSIPETRDLMNGEFHDKDRWFTSTRDADYPDAPFQISQLFDADRCGDIVVSSTLGWDFMDQGHKASHGGLERDELMVPCVVAGPGIKEGATVPQGRTVDIFSIFLRFFGIPNLDGGVPDVFKA